MSRYSENYKNSGSKTVEQIERDAYIVSTLSVSANGKGTGFRHEFAFIVSKSRGRGALLSVKEQCSNGNEIRQSLIKARRNVEILSETHHGLSKPVQAAKKRVDDLAYLNSLLDSCFKEWHVT
ncbi:hypothetical protein [Paenisporosarcina sp. OV554]|uniref:hypothetical protein n=1 Tax=Paenisporosarcina sp. OV554 TaxID=2135694 RepID=UPI000D336CFA|nr:hypothetical protein [Paenisporosarcina sp. OV554]PUB12596.1 hypothetical protein C8K15_10995 [Paenisporosarcina sp. OV554]